MQASQDEQSEKYDIYRSNTQSNPLNKNGNRDAIKCESCRYKVTQNDSRFVDCLDCGSYYICHYCFYDIKDRRDEQMKEDQIRRQQESNSDSGDSQDEEEKANELRHFESSTAHPNCIYCWSKTTLTDM